MFLWDILLGPRNSCEDIPPVNIYCQLCLRWSFLNLVKCWLLCLWEPPSLGDFVLQFMCMLWYLNLFAPSIGMLLICTGAFVKNTIHKSLLISYTSHFQYYGVTIFHIWLAYPIGEVWYHCESILFVKHWLLYLTWQKFHVYIYVNLYMWWIKMFL